MRQDHSTLYNRGLLFMTLSARVLVLNKNFIPIETTSVRRAFLMLYQSVAKVVDEEYRTYDFHSWSELSVEAHHQSLGLVNRLIRLPKVILLNAYDRMPQKTVRFSRLNIFLRDQHTCQYCGKKLEREQLNLDHVVPKSKGGKSNWENVVCSCIPCNYKKGSRSPSAAGMKLIRKPVRPRWSFLSEVPKHNLLDWKPFLNIVDYSYWNLEIES